MKQSPLPLFRNDIEILTSEDFAKIINKRKPSLQYARKLCRSAVKRSDNQIYCRRVPTEFFVYQHQRDFIIYRKLKPKKQKKKITIERDL